MTTDILDLDATDQLAALAARRITAMDLLGLAMARQSQTHDQLNVVVATDTEQAMAQARASDMRRARGEPLGALEGLPMTLKDTLDVIGMPASAGLAALRDRRSGDSTVAARARAAGAILWGKTNVPVMAGDWQSFNGLYGASNNPWNLSRTTGGSSGGAAAALATGITALEIGSDIGGSLRVPANFCGIYSHKPSWGAVCQRGHVPPHPGARAPRDINVIGPMARSARDLKHLFSVIADHPHQAEAAPDLRSLRVGLWLDEPRFPLDPEVRAVIEAYAASLAAAGVHIDPVSSPVDSQVLRDTYTVLLGAILGADLSPEQYQAMAAQRPALLAANDPAALSLLAYTASHLEWMEANETRAALVDQVALALAPYDVIIAPVSPVVAFPHDHAPFRSRRLTPSTGEAFTYNSMLDWVALASLCHLPATCVPAGLTPGGMPVGVQLIGSNGADAHNLAVAESFSAIRAFIPPPMI